MASNYQGSFGSSIRDVRKRVHAPAASGWVEAKVGFISVPKTAGPSPVSTAMSRIPLAAASGRGGPSRTGGQGTERRRKALKLQHVRAGFRCKPQPARYSSRSWLTAASATSATSLSRSRPNRRIPWIFLGRLRSPVTTHATAGWVNRSTRPASLEAEPGASRPLRRSGTRR